MSNFQYNLFSPTCCNPCLLKPFAVSPGKLSKCLGCKLVLYCSTGHQRMDWRIHRKFCQAASAILEGHKANHLFAINGPIKTQDELSVTTLKVKYMLKSILKRNLSFHEEELTSFPVMCAICYSTKMSKLYQCKKCNAVSYCCEEHEQQDAPKHSWECGQLKLYYCKFKLKSEMVVKLKSLTNCNLFESDLESAMKTMFGIEYAPDPSERLAEYQKFSFVSDFSCIATVSFVMKHLDMERYQGEEFTMYVVGATMDEVWFAPTHVQFFFACFPQLKKLNVIFIGPELCSKTRKPAVCDLGEGRSLLRLSYRGKLEDYFIDRTDRLKPNLIACFNCGFSENTELEGNGDSWCPAIQYMMELTQIPLLFTSYTSLEADFDFGALMKVIEERKNFNSMHLERIVAKQRNPFRDMRPLRTWLFNDPERIYYRNGYVQAVRVKTIDF